MDHYRQRIDIQADPATVYAALTTPAGLQGWWTRDCEVPTQVGGRIRLRFGRTHKELRIAGLEPERAVRWRCIQAHIAAPQLTRRDEWVGTEIGFRLAPLGSGGTRLDFEHLGLVPALECYGLCDQGWRHFLESLRRFAETGHGMPYEPKVAAGAQ